MPAFLLKTPETQFAFCGLRSLGPFDGLHPRQGLDRGVPACHLPQAAWFGQPGADQRDLGPGRHAPAPAPCMAVRLCQGKPGDWLVDGEHDQLEAWLSSTA
eukprot:scaffold31505_cov15-Tisochrysis_lutea.AAC.1